MYIDRMQGIDIADDTLVCPQCQETLGAKMIYKKEDRPAYRLFVGSVTKKIVKTQILKAK